VGTLKICADYQVKTLSVECVDKMHPRAGAIWCFQIVNGMQPESDCVDRGAGSRVPFSSPPSKASSSLPFRKSCAILAQARNEASPQTAK
jgi:hypothetical protein